MLVKGLCVCVWPQVVTIWHWKQHIRAFVGLFSNSHALDLCNWVDFSNLPSPCCFCLVSPPSPVNYSCLPQFQGSLGWLRAQTFPLTTTSFHNIFLGSHLSSKILQITCCYNMPTIPRIWVFWNEANLISSFSRGWQRPQQYHVYSIIPKQSKLSIFPFTFLTLKIIQLSHGSFITFTRSNSIYLNFEMKLSLEGGICTVREVWWSHFYIVTYSDIRKKRFFTSQINKSNSDNSGS